MKVFKGIVVNRTFHSETERLPKIMRSVPLNSLHYSSDPVDSWMGDWSDSEKNGRIFGLESMSPNSEWRAGVDIDFLSSSVPGSLGALEGQGVKGTYLKININVNIKYFEKSFLNSAPNVKLKL